MIQPDLPSEEETREINEREGSEHAIDMNPPVRYMFAHANLIKDIPNSVFNNKPFQLVKRYEADADETYLNPRMYLTVDPKPIGGCINYYEGNGEPATVVEKWETFLFPNFNKVYFDLGGTGGGGRELK